MAASADEMCGLNDLECKASACLAGQYGLGMSSLYLHLQKTAVVSLESLQVMISPPYKACPSLHD